MRVTDILLEFAPPTPEEEELAQQAVQEPAEQEPVAQEPAAEPAPVQQATPTPQPVPAAAPAPQMVQEPAPVPPAPEENKNIPIITKIVINKFKKLIADANSLPDWDPAKRLVLKLVDTIKQDTLAEAKQKIEMPSEADVTRAIIEHLSLQGIIKLDKTIDIAALAIKTAKASKVSKSFKALEAKWKKQAEELTNQVFDKLEKLANKVQGYTSIDDDVYKKLNKADKKIHDNARNFADIFKQAFFGMIMRMLRNNQDIERERIIEFLDACYEGRVISMETLIEQDVGNVKDHVNADYNDMLDLFSQYGVFTWSPGRSSGAIGPGEMALSMMGSPAQKAQHGGDLIVNGVNLEIKAGGTSGGRLNSKKLLKGPAAWPVWTKGITDIVKKSKKIPKSRVLGVRQNKAGDDYEVTKDNYTPNTWKKNAKGHPKEGCVYNWSSGMLAKLNNEVLIYSDYQKTYDLFFNTISALITNLNDVAEPMMITANKKSTPKLNPDGSIAFPGVDAETEISAAVYEDGTIDVDGMMNAFTKLAYASYNRADGVETILFLNTFTLDYTIVKNGDDLVSKLGQDDSPLKISGGFTFNDDQQSATPQFLPKEVSERIAKI